MGMRVIDTVTPAILKLQRNIPGYLRKQAEENAQELVEEIRSFTPMKTGEMRKRITPGPVRRHGVLRRFSVEITGHHPRTSEIEYGTRWHVIEPKPGNKALSFFWSKTGKREIFRRVDHPGNVGHHMFSKGVASFEAKHVKRVRASIIGLFKRSGF